MRGKVDDDVVARRAGEALLDLRGVAVRPDAVRMDAVGDLAEEGRLVTGVRERGGGEGAAAAAAAAARG